MNTQNAINQVEIFCRNVITTGSAFGIRVDTGEQVFIPSAVVRASRLEEGETAMATIAPNRHENDATPWFCIRINRNAAQAAPSAQAAAPAYATITPTSTQPTKPAPTIDDRALSIILDADGYMTTAEVAADLGTDSSLAHNALLRLFNQGKIAKADVYGAGGQSRPSFCLWAESAQTFVGGDDE